MQFLFRYCNFPSTCSWSTLPRMTAKRAGFSLVCLPPDEGGLIAIGGYNGDSFIDVVECLDDEGATEWRRLAPLPLPLSSPGGGVYFKHRILVVGGQTTGYAKTSVTLAFTPPSAGGAGQWVTLKPTLPRAEYPMHITISGNSLYLVSKFTPPTWFLFIEIYWNFANLGNFQNSLLNGYGFFSFR